MSCVLGMMNMRTEKEGAKMYFSVDLATLTPDKAAYIAHAVFVPKCCKSLGSTKNTALCHLL